MQTLDSRPHVSMDLSFKSFQKIGQEELNRMSQIQHPHLIQFLYNDSFRKILKLFNDLQNYPNEVKKEKTARRVINGLNSLMAKNVLQIESKENAIAISKSLGAITPMIRLQVYQTERYGDFDIIPLEIIRIIFMSSINNEDPSKYSPETNRTKEIVRLLYVSKSINKLFLVEPEILSLNSFREKINDDHLEKLSHIFPNLKDLSLYGTEITDDGLAKFKCCKNLTSLDLGSCDNITGKRMALKYFTNLIRLSLFCTPNFSEEGLAPMKDLSDLVWLNLCKCRGVTDVGLSHLNGLKLTSVDLTWGAMTSKGLVTCLKSLTNLTALRFENCFHLDSWGGTSFDNQRTLKHDIFLRRLKLYPHYNEL